MSKLKELAKDAAKKHTASFWKKYASILNSQPDQDVLTDTESVFHSSIIDALTRFAEEVEREVIGDGEGTSFDHSVKNRFLENQKQKLATLLTQWKGTDDKAV